jgi:hypothetical protein
MKRLVIAISLACVISTSAFAGEIPSVGITTTRPDGETGSTTLPGEIPSGGLSYEIADSALDLIQMLIGVGI